MMVMSMLRIEGDPDNIIERMHDVEEVATRIAPEMGGISSTMLRTEGGIIVVNLWKDEHGRHRMADHPQMRAAMLKANLPEPHAEGYEVIRHLTVSAAGSGLTGGLRGARRGGRCARSRRTPSTIGRVCTPPSRSCRCRTGATRTRRRS